MSVGSFLRTVGHDIKVGVTTALGIVTPTVGTVGTLAINLLSLYNPVLGAIAGKALATVVGLEGIYQTEKQGVAKKQSFVQIMAAELPQIESLAQHFGVNFKLPVKELGDVADAIVNMYNTIKAFVLATEQLNGKTVIVAAAPVAAAPIPPVI